MTNKELISFCVQKEWETLFSTRPEITKFLKGHERKDLLIGNLEREIRMLELNPRFKIDKDLIISLSIDFARSFAKVATRVKEREIKTDQVRMFEQAIKDRKLQEENLEIDLKRMGVTEATRDEQEKNTR